MEVSICKTIAVPSEGLQTLPRQLATSDEDRTLTVDRLLDAHVDAAYGIVCECAARGDNVGLDEYPSREDFLAYMLPAFKFSICDPKSGSLQGILCIRGIDIGRSYGETVAAISMFLIRDLSRDDHMKTNLIRLAESFVLELKCGFSASSVSVGMDCSHVIDLLKSEGYISTCILPFSYKTIKGELIEMTLLYKTLTSAPFTMHPVDVINRVVDDLVTVSTEGDFNDIDLPRHPLLPISLTGARGSQVIVRHIYKEEAMKFYDLLRDAANESKGFAVAEYPTLKEFLMWTLAKSYTVVVEDARKKGEWLVVSSLFDFPCARTQAKGLLASGLAITTPKFRGTGLFKEFLLLQPSLAKALGYRAHISDVICDNKIMQSLSRRMNYVPIGTVPRSAFMRRKGWRDSIVYYLDLATVKPLHELYRVTPISPAVEPVMSKL